MKAFNFIQLLLVIVIADSQAYRFPLQRYQIPVARQGPVYSDLLPLLRSNPNIPDDYSNQYSNDYLRSENVPLIELRKGVKKINLLGPQASKEELTTTEALAREVEVDLRLLEDLPKDKKDVLVKRVTREERLSLLHQLHSSSLTENRFSNDENVVTGVTASGENIAEKLIEDISASIGSAIGAYLVTAATKYIDYLSPKTNETNEESGSLRSNFNYNDRYLSNAQNDFL